MKKYWILWTYIANHSNLIELEAETPEHALRLAVGQFSEDFQNKGNVYVFDKEPVLIQKPKNPFHR